MSDQRAGKSAIKTILVADDQPLILDFVSSFLAQKGYLVFIAATGEDALQRSRDYKEPIHLLLSNIQMPGMTGIELGTKISLERPDIKVLLMSGFASGMLVLNEGWHFLHKPFIPSQLLSIIKTVLGQPATAPDLDEHKSDRL